MSKGEMRKITKRIKEKSNGGEKWRWNEQVKRMGRNIRKEGRR
jgi:hypothetical protein